jgi:hypothetical protein
MSVTSATGSVIAQPGQQFSFSSLFTLGSGLPSTIGVAILDDNNYTVGNPGALGYFSGNGATSQISLTTSNQKTYTYEVFQYDLGSGQYLNATLGSLSHLTYVAPTGTDHAELLTVFSFKNGLTLDYGNLTDLSDLSIVTAPSFVNPFPAATPGQATPGEICAIAQSFVGKVWNSNGCQLLGNVVAGLSGSSLPFTALAQISADQSPTLALPNGEWMVAYDGRTQANPSYAAVEAMIRPGDIVNIAWLNTSDSNGHLFTVVSGSGANALVIDNEQTGSNGAGDGSASDIVIQPPHSLDETLHEYDEPHGGAVPASIEVYRLDTPVVTAQGTPPILPAASALALSGLFTASDPAGKPVVDYQVYDTAAGNVFAVGGTQQTAHSAATALSVSSLADIALVGGTSSGSDVIEVRGFNGSYWGDWQALSVTAAPGLSAAQVISEAAAGQTSSGTGIVDSAKTILLSLDSLSALASKHQLGSISLTDSGIPMLTVTAAQGASDAPALNEISGYFSVTQMASGSSQVIAGFSNALGNLVEFSGSASQYTITPAGDGIHVTVSGNGVTDQLSNIQALQFSDHALIVAQTPGTSSVTSGNITELYGAVFGREPDAAGLAYYEKEAAANPATPIVTYAEGFLSSPEYTGNSAHAYAQTAAGDGQFVTDTYTNLLHRAPEAGAVQWYETNVINPIISSDTAAGATLTQAELHAHAQLLTYFAASQEFLGDVQVTAQNPASAQHWLVLI